MRCQKQKLAFKKDVKEQLWSSALNESFAEEWRWDTACSGFLIAAFGTCAGSGGKPVGYSEPARKRQRGRPDGTLKLAIQWPSSLLKKMG